MYEFINLYVNRKIHTFRTIFFAFLIVTYDYI